MSTFTVLISIVLCCGFARNIEGVKLLIGLGDSFTSGGGTGSYPKVAGELLKWQALNYAKGGAKMNGIPAQLTTAAQKLQSATHIVFTIGGNDLGVADSLLQVVLMNNYTAVATKAASLKPRLVATYKMIQAAAKG
ncbi:unnamed protein product [Didymodactylos carnosus]|uniref:SGNH hydrolase-type esterase domain-containing protein n=1 Tax=Didymodactylos carnosus TaxID=1234261 RepID=A0A8S2F6X6_9BILA|nr:unnamed protein product [Didymodactylos carnosus]CAF4175435.1 unnamed protein product [Didymodactylos carnosus]